MGGGGKKAPHQLSVRIAFACVFEFAIISTNCACVRRPETKCAFRKNKMQ